MADAHTTITLKFLDWQELYETKKPFQVLINVPDDAKDKRTTNLVFKTISLPALDIRSCREVFSLDRNGFQFCRHASALANFLDKGLVESVYLPEVEALLKENIEGVDKVFCFDWRLRNTLPEVENIVIDLNDPMNWLRPATHVHVNQSPSAVLNRVKFQFKEEARALFKGRLSVWRPLVNAVEDWPLAICDGSTVHPDDLVETDHVRRHYTGSTMYLMHNPAQRFYYMSRQSKNDVLIFKNFDSKRGIKGKYAPHASFRHPNPPEVYDPRESIEVRAMVFTERK